VSSVLIEQEDWFAGRADAGSGARGLDLHEGDQAVDFGFLRGEFGEDAAEAEGVFAEGGADEVVSGGGGVALVEDEVDDFEDGGEAGGELGAARDFEGDVFFGEGAFGADDALSDGGFGGEEGAGDLSGGEAAEETEGEGGAGLGGEDGVTGDEDEAEEVVSDGVVEGGVEVRHGLFECGEVACQVFVFTLGDGVAAEEIDGAAFGGGGEPCAGFSGTPVRGHCSRAARRASCARSSARPTSRVRRVRPAMTRADSMRQTASMVRCRSVADTATDHTSFGSMDASAAIAARRRPNHAWRHFGAVKARLSAAFHASVKATDSGACGTKMSNP
jgi:hypothetical protein